MFSRTALKLSLGLAMTALVMTTPEVQAQQAAARIKPARTGYVPANGVNYYYEIYGRGAPLLVLHGGLGSIEMFGPILPKLAQGRQVIAVDLQGHGRTALGDRPITLPAMADDIAAVVKQLGQDTVDVFGYSLGGGVALRLAIQHPEVVRRLVLVSTPYAQDGFYPDMLPQQAQVGAAMAPMMKETPMYKSYVAVAPPARRLSPAARSHGRIDAHIVRLDGGRQEAQGARDARVWRCGHDSARPRRAILSTVGWRAEGCGLAARAHVAESTRDSSERHAL